MSSSRIAALSAAAIAGLLGCHAAEAHVVAEPNEGPAGGYFRTAFRVSHGCGGSATTAITIQLPPGTLAARPQVKPGWSIAITKRPVDPPVPGQHGSTITETLDTITWRGGPLSNDHFDEFGLSMKLPAGAAGTTLWFPVVQSCVEGENRWVEIPAEGQRLGDLKSPAPFVRLRAAPPAAPAAASSEHKH